MAKTLLPLFKLREKSFPKKGGELYSNSKQDLMPLPSYLKGGL